MTALTLPPGKTEDEAVRIARGHREVIWSTVRGGEEKRIDTLVDWCTRMCCGDKVSGKRLASLAIWTPSP